jgi:hypothetical protein
MYNWNLTKMFGRKRRNNRGVMWASIVGLGISAAAALRRRRNQNNHMDQSVKNLMNTLPTMKNGQTPNLAAIATEFSKELTQSKDQSEKE